MFFSCLLFTQYADAETPPWNQLSPEAARIIERAELSDLAQVLFYTTTTTEHTPAHAVVRRFSPLTPSSTLGVVGPVLMTRSRVL